VVSFIVVGLNGASTIFACLETIKQQSLAPESFEIIVVDNGSKDGSYETLVKIKGIVVLQEPRRGRGFARNAGARAARFDKLAFIDCDVLLPPDWGMRLALALRPPFGAVQAPIKINFRSKWSERLVRPQARGHFIGRYSLLFTIDSAAMMVRRSAFQECGGFATDLVRWEDSDFTQRLLHFGHGLLVLPELGVQKIETRGLFSRSYRSIELGKTYQSLIARWFDDGPGPRLRQLKGILQTRPSLDRALFCLGLLFPLNTPGLKMPRAKGWRQVEDGVLFSRNFTVAACPEFIRFTLTNLRMPFLLEASTPAFRELYPKICSGQDFLKPALTLLAQESSLPSRFKETLESSVIMASGGP
jgi:hypothetical protein